MVGFFEGLSLCKYVGFYGASGYLVLLLQLVDLAENSKSVHYGFGECMGCSSCI